MTVVSWIVLVSAVYPLLRAWQANRRTSLLQTMSWATAAWAAWVWALYPGRTPEFAVMPTYIALSLTACAIIGVLGARWPGAAAWNFVLAGLLALLLVPVAEALASDRDLSLGDVRTLFLTATLAVGLVNYLPTRLALPMLTLFFGCAGAILALAEHEGTVDSAMSVLPWSRLAVAVSPWLAYAVMRRRRQRSRADELWLGFRDRYGWFWGQRLREQFNCAAANAGYDFVLGWQGLRGQPQADAAAVELLQALLKRFTVPEAEAISSSIASGN